MEQVVCGTIARAQAETSRARYRSPLRNRRRLSEGQQRAASRLSATRFVTIINNVDNKVRSHLQALRVVRSECPDSLV